MPVLVAIHLKRGGRPVRVFANAFAAASPRQMRRLAQHHDKVPAAPVFDLVNGNMHLAYASNIKTVGAVSPCPWGSSTGALEGSARWNAPLPSVSAPGRCSAVILQR